MRSMVEGPLHRTACGPPPLQMQRRNYVNLFDLSGKVAIVTGSSRGSGGRLRRLWPIMAPKW